MRTSRRTSAGAAIGAIAAALLVAGCGSSEPARPAAPSDPAVASRRAPDAVALHEEAPGLLARAGVTEAVARAAALARVPGGRVLEAELEEEDGVLQYAYDIRAADGRLLDVEVDARTGRVRRVERDDEDREADADDARG